MNSIAKIMQKKIKVTMDSGILCTSKEVILYTKISQMSELVSVEIFILYSILDKVMVEDKEIEEDMKEVASLQHQV
jgi:hypothetical protein